MLAAIETDMRSANSDFFTGTADSGFGGVTMTCSTVAGALQTRWISPGS